MTPQALLSRVLSEDRGRLLAALISRVGDFQRAEDALQEAAASALVHWGRAGVPASPTGWLLRAALRKAIDGYRRDTTLARHRDAIAVLAEEEAAEPDPQTVPDDRLRLIFTCCHPALEEKTRIALTLRSLCGLTTPQVAAVFLDVEATMGQRLSRAKAKIAAARIPYAIPGPEDLPERLNSVLTVVYLIFTAGYAQGPATGTDLCDEAIFLARLLQSLAPDQPEVEGALALLLITHARRAARMRQGETVALSDQDRALWDRALLNEGLAILDTATARRRPGPFQIKAAIAALQCQTPADWPQIAALYLGLYRHETTPVVRLNLAVALAEAGSLPDALAILAALEASLTDYQPYHAACAEYFARAGDLTKAHAAYDRAVALATPADAAFLSRRRAHLAKKKAEHDARPSPTGRYEGTRARSSSLREFK
ncbi:MAG: RNA polymerase [Tabrizicola sp.]|jgi:RNA polymerase sigma-70 factor (ECF subfamily)|nr:RNA polymerase [Tabrizicola sp.]